MSANLRAIAQQFQIPGRFLDAHPLGNGHINDTFRATFSGGRQFVFQRLNHSVFKNPVAVMENIQRVTEYLRGKLSNRADANRRVLTLIPACDGKPFFCAPGENFWRAFHFIENARTFDALEHPRQAYEAAKAFGHFQKLLADLPPPRLHETIPDFHHTPKRFVALEKAVETDAVNRANIARPEIEFAQRRKPVCGVLLDANLPERATHNDTKLNNVLFDNATGEGICVLDLDTVMPGLAVFDFGDLVRSAANSAVEDERDLAKVEMQFPLFEALARGYLESAGEFLTPAEKHLLAVSGKIISLELGVRFLTDFLAGDIYFKIHRPNQNLDRCRAQFKLVESMESQLGKMERLVAELCK